MTLTRNFSSGRCTSKGTGSFDSVGGEMAIAEGPPGDRYSQSLSWSGWWSITRTCPEGSETRRSYDGWRVTTQTQPWTPGATALSGSTAFKVTFAQTEDITVARTWTLSAE